MDMLYNLLNTIYRIIFSYKMSKTMGLAILINLQLFHLLLENLKKYINSKWNIIKKFIREKNVKQDLKIIYGTFFTI